MVLEVRTVVAHPVRLCDPQLDALQTAAVRGGALLGMDHAPTCGHQVHLTGPEAKLDELARATLGVSLKDIVNALPKNP